MSFLVEKLDKPLPVHSKFRKKIIELSQVNTKDLVNYVINDNNILLPIFQARNAVVTEDYHSRIGSYGIDKLDFFLVKDSLKNCLAGYAIVFPGIKECIEDENRIYEVINDHGTIFAIVIDNKYRGNKLFKLLIDTIKEKYSEIQAECFPKLVPLYEREGFVAITSNDAQVVMQYAEVLPLVDSYKVNSGNHDQAFSRVDGIYKDIICQYGETRVAEANIDIDAATKLVAEIARKIFN